jgi:hypothetical protein
MITDFYATPKPPVNVPPMGSNEVLRRIYELLNENTLAYNTKVLDSQALDALRKSTIVPAINQVTHDQIAVGNSAVPIVSANASRREIAFINMSATIDLFVGSSTVTTSNGFRIAPGMSIVLAIYGTLYGVRASTNDKVCWLEVGQ